MTKQPGTYDPAVTVEVGETYRHPMAMSDDLIVRVTRVWDSEDGGGQMAACAILSGGMSAEEAIARHGSAPETEMDTRAWTLIPVSDDPYDEVARSQGFGPMHDRLRAENIPHELDATGGAPPVMLVRVPLDGDAYLHIDRSSDWFGSLTIPDGWTVIKFLDKAGEVFEDVGFDLTMTEAVAAVRSARGGT